MSEVVCAANSLPASRQRAYETAGLWFARIVILLSGWIAAEPWYHRGGRT
jgi:hypothetical protein